MKFNVSDTLIKALHVTREVIGCEPVSDAAMKVMLRDLAGYPEEQVLAALKRCMREVKGRYLPLAEILQRLDDGRPGPEEAWAAIPKDEAASIVWSTEMRDAYAVARPLIVLEDLVAARVAFLEKYKVLVQQSRDARYPVKWEVSLGTDKDGRELALLDAAQKGRMGVDHALALLPYHREDEGLRARFLEIAGRKPELPNPDARKRFGEMMQAVKLKALPAPKKAA